MNQDALKSLFSSATALVAAIAGWQEQAQFWVSICSSAVAIIGAVISICYAVRGRKDK